MKKLISIILLLSFLICILASCAVSPNVEISEDGYWIINGEKTNVKAEGAKGDQGIPGSQGAKGDQGIQGPIGPSGETPTVEISEDGYWVINGVKTDVKAKGEDGKDATGTPSTPIAFTVTFDTQCDIVIPSQQVVSGMKATKPTMPNRSGYKFDGWYVGDEMWSFIGYSVTENITLTAKWSPSDDFNTPPVPLPST